MILHIWGAAVCFAPGLRGLGLRGLEGIARALASQPHPGEASSSPCLSAFRCPQFACERARGIASWRADVDGSSYFAELPFRNAQDDALGPDIRRAVGVGAKGLSARGCKADIVGVERKMARRNSIIIFCFFSAHISNRFRFSRNILKH